MCAGKAVINHRAQMHVHISASLMKNTSPHATPKKVHKSLLNNKSLARRKYCINPGCTGPTQHTAALSILCVPAKRRYHPHAAQTAKIYSIIATNLGRWNYEKTVPGKTLPVTNLLPQAFLPCPNLLFTAKDRDLVLTSVFFSQTICV